VNVDLTIGTGALSLDDIAPRLYQGTQRASLAGATLLPSPDDSTLYKLTAAADDPGSFFHLTYEYPEGVWFSDWWGPGNPPAVIVPVRENGLDLAGLGAKLFRDGADVSGLLRILPMGSVSEPGDYGLYGWPSTSERWLLRWEVDGIIYRRSWGGEAVVSGDRLDVANRALSAFTYLWRAASPPAPLAAMPYVLAPGGNFKPQNQAPFVSLDVLLDKGNEWGPPGMKTYELPGLLQVGIQVKDGDGDPLATALLRIAAECVQGMRVQGLKVYGCRGPYDLPAPMPGYYGLAVDAPALYVGP
jgi:hypothetical protein